MALVALCLVGFISAEYVIVAPTDIQICATSSEPGGRETWKAQGRGPRPRARQGLRSSFGLHIGNWNISVHPRRRPPSWRLAVTLRTAPADPPSPDPPPVFCAFADSTTIPQIGKVKTCAKVAIQGNGFGSAEAFAKSEAKTVKMASSACGDAVANGMSDLCTGSDPMTTIYAMAQTCASAVAEVYSKSVSGASVSDSKAMMDVWKRVKNTYSAPKYLMACGNSCANAESCSHAFAQAAACGVSSATDNCAAAGSYVSTKSFSKAFVSAVASSWSSACAKGLGKAQSSGEVVASVTAKSIAKAFAQAAATACTSCDICKCKDLPKGYTWNDVSNFADATAQTTGVSGGCSAGWGVRGVGALLWGRCCGALPASIGCMPKVAATCHTLLISACLLAAPLPQPQPHALTVIPACAVHHPLPPPLTPSHPL